MPAAERFWPEIPAVAQRYSDIVRRQVIIYGMFCERYRELRRKLKLFRYEDIIFDPSNLSDFLERRYIRKIAINNSNRPGSTEGVEISIIRENLQKHCPIALDYYPDLGDF